MMFHLIKKATLWFICIAVLIVAGVSFVWVKWFEGPNKPIITEPRLEAAVIDLSGNKTIVEFVSELKEKNIIKSEAVTLSLIHRLGIEKKIKQGLYVFKGNEDVFIILARLANGTYGFVPVRVTIPEGFTVRKMAETFSEKLVDIKPEDFIKEAEPMEGYLFPDTYFFYPYATSSVVISMMMNNFDRQITPFKDEIQQLTGIGVSDLNASSTASSTMITATERTYGVPKDLKDIVTMASILEKEVQTEEDMALVADLFWRRIRAGMAMQADSTLTYATGKTSAQLSLKDLRAKSPYNSYINLGLPPTPIANPGLGSIKAALFPQKNKYVYFLSDKDGKTHFSMTYEEHLRLKKKYLP